MKNLFEFCFSIPIVLCLCALVFVSGSEDLPCIPKSYPESNVCVCNSTYCDTIGDLPPLTANQYVLYTSNMDGARFVKTYGFFKNSTQVRNSWLWGNQVGSPDIYLNELKTYQNITGFGGAVTDAAGINIKKLSAGAQDMLLRSYFSPEGIQYNMIRVPIGGSDFSTRSYTYNELPIGDTKLSNFSLAMEDIQYKIPVIQTAQSLSSEKILVLGAVWSPPTWMKTNNEITGMSRLKPEYYQTHADYHLKFIQQYEQRNVPIWGISTGNEPESGLTWFVQFNTLGWTPSEQADWVVNNLGPTIKKYGDIKIIALDDQRLALPWWIKLMVSRSPKVLDYIDGIGVHWYFDYLPASLLSWTHNLYPNKFLLATEACEGSVPFQSHVVLGSWKRAENYAYSIIQDLTNYMVGWLDWNIALDETGGPNWSGNFVDSPIIVMPVKDQFYKQPMFYAMGHFSKFIPRGSVRIDLVQKTSGVDSVAFKRPDGYIVVVVLNRNNKGKYIKIQTNNNTQVVLKLTRKSINTMLFGV